MAVIQLYNSFSAFEQPYVDSVCEHLIDDLLGQLNISSSLGIDPERLAEYKASLYTKFNETNHA